MTSKAKETETQNIETQNEATSPMSIALTPDKAPTKRRGLALPPRGQTLSRLQDLEFDTPEEAVQPQDNIAAINAVNDAVRTASSNAVNDEGSTQGDTVAAVIPSQPPSIVVQPQPVAASPETRPLREPTTRITVDMPDSLHRHLSHLSVETRRTIKDLVIEALKSTYFQADETIK